MQGSGFTSPATCTTPEGGVGDCSILNTSYRDCDSFCGSKKCFQNENFPDDYHAHLGLETANINTPNFYMEKADIKRDEVKYPRLCDKLVVKLRTRIDALHSRQCSLSLIGKPLILGCAPSD